MRIPSTSNGQSEAQVGMGSVSRRDLLDTLVRRTPERSQRGAMMQRIRAYNARRAQGFLLLHGPVEGPKVLKQLGLSPCLRGSELRTIVVTAGITEAGRAQGDSDHGEYLYEGLQELLARISSGMRHGKLSRRLAIAATALAGLGISACGDDPSPTGPGGGGTPAIVTGRVVAHRSGAGVNGYIDFLRKTTNVPNNILVTGEITDGSFRVQLPDYKDMQRVRIRGGRPGGPDFLAAELNNWEILYGGTTSGYDLVVVEAEDGLPDFYNKVNRNADVPAGAKGLHKVALETNLFYANRDSVKPGQTPNAGRLLELSQNAVYRLYHEITDLPADTVELVDSPETLGSNRNLVFEFGDITDAETVYLGPEVLGGLVTIAGNATQADVDAAFAKLLFFVARSNSIRPSMANTNADGTLYTVDHTLLGASKVETPGTMTHKTFDGVKVDSYEMPKPQSR
jgi:hypothetical protein